MTAQVKLFKPKHAARRTQDNEDDELFTRLGIIEDRADLIQQIHRGFPAAAVERLADELQIPQQRLLKIARIASATLTRRRKSIGSRLSPEESDRIYRIADAFRDALRLFERDSAAARNWLIEPAKALAGSSPLEHLTTEAGASEVRHLIGRLEHGVYS